MYILKEKNVYMQSYITFRWRLRMAETIHSFPSYPTVFGLKWLLIEPA